jgi:hypothetical protein
MIYKNGIKTIVQFNTDRYVTSLMKKQCETFDAFFTYERNNPPYANDGFIRATPIASREKEISSYSIYVIAGTDSDAE